MRPYLVEDPTTHGPRCCALIKAALPLLALLHSGISDQPHRHCRPRLQAPAPPYTTPVKDAAQNIAAPRHRAVQYGNCNCNVSYTPRLQLVYGNSAPQRPCAPEGAAGRGGSAVPPALRRRCTIPTALGLPPRPTEVPTRAYTPAYAGTCMTMDTMQVDFGQIIRQPIWSCISCKAPLAQASGMA